MRRRGQHKGRISLDDIVIEGGVVVHVALDKESGVFHADYFKTHEGENIHHHETKAWQGKDLEQIRKDVRDWAKKEKALKWEPVIAVGPVDTFGMHQAKNVLGQKFERLMRAKKVDGEGYEWRYWAYNKPADKNGHTGFIYDKDLEVYPPSGSTSEPSAWRDGETEPVVMEYTPERWLALLQLVQMEKALRTKLLELVEGGEKKLTTFLAQVPSIGLLGLAPKQKA